MPQGFAIRFEGGPFDGKTTFLKPEAPDPPERIWAFDSILHPGLTLFVSEPVTGDADEHPYVQVSKSQLPPEMDHPNVMRGGVYRYEGG